jgi:hypothetical protein
MITVIKAAFSIAVGDKDATDYPLRKLFILDSGSTCHITNNPNCVYGFQRPTPGDYIWAGNLKAWIKGYGSIDLTLKNNNNNKATKVTLQDVAICPGLLCNLVSFRLLRHKGIWWDTRSDPTTLRGAENRTIGTVIEMHGQWVLEYQPLPAALFHTCRITTRTKRGPQRATALLWHKRLGHPGPASIEHLVQQSEGVRIKGITTVQCNSCGRAKSRRQISCAPQINNDGPGERLSIDLHSYKHQAVTKEKSQMLITCKFSKMQWDVYFTDNRTAKSIIKALSTFILFLKNHYNISVKTIEADNEITIVKPEVERWLATQGIIVESSAPNTQAQNGGAERSEGVNKEEARAMRLDANLSWELWPEVTRAAVYLYNRTPNYANHWKTPYKIFFTRVAFSNGIVTSLRKPHLSHLKAYGCKAFTMTDDTHRNKSRLQCLNPKA